MTEPVARAVVDAFYKAYAERDIETVAEFIADDVDWTISGPPDVLKFCGTYRGKAAVLDLMARRVPEVFQIFCFIPSTMLVDGDKVSSLNRLWAKRAEDGRVISYRLAHFMRFENGKVVENFSLIDSFDAVEQVLGHQLDVHISPSAPGNRVAL
jgi:ketosteroid isomerase-like protein